MKKKISFLRFFLIATGLALTFSCASTLNSGFESCQFALDSADYDTAMTSCTAALADDPTDVDSRLLLSSAYAGKANIELLNIMDDMQDTSGTGGDNNDFDIMRTIMAAIMSDADDLADLRNAISTLDNATYWPTDATADNYKRYFFQLGLLQMLEAFGLPTLTAQPVGTDFTATSADNLDTDDRNAFEDDLLDADNNLVKGGQDATDSSLISTIRQNYRAVYDAVEAAGGEHAFTLNRMKDFVRCQLDSTGTTFSEVANCAVFVFAESAVDTSL